MLPLNHINFSAGTHSIERVHLSEECTRQLERSSVFSVSEKVHILCLLAGYQQITDIGLETDNLAAYRQELQMMKIPFIEESCGDTHWLLAGASVALLDYLQEKRATLSEVEAGTLYGYPVTAALAFTGVFPSRMHHPVSAATFFLGGVYSVDFYKDEIAYYEMVWRVLSDASPVISKQAEVEFAKKI